MKGASIAGVHSSTEFHILNNSLLERYVSISLLSRTKYDRRLYFQFVCLSSSGYPCLLAADFWSKVIVGGGVSPTGSWLGGGDGVPQSSPGTWGTHWPGQGQGTPSAGRDTPRIEYWADGTPRFHEGGFSFLLCLNFLFTFQLTKEFFPTNFYMINPPPRHFGGIYGSRCRILVKKTQP